MSYALCPRCGQRYKLKKDGRMSIHRGHRIGEKWCKGSGKKPNKEES